MLAVSYAREVDDDLADATRWYVEQGPDLGESFLRDFQQTAGVIVSAGQVCRLVARDYRRVHLKNHPYAVYFTVHGEKAVVYLVIHTRRDPALVARVLRDRR